MRRGRKREHRLHPVARVAIIVIALVVIVNVVLGLLDTSTRGADETAPRSSSLSTGSTGVAAWAELLRRNGHRVEALRGRLNDHDLPARATLAILDPMGIDRDEQRAVRAFLRQGGRLVVGGPMSSHLLEAELHRAPIWSPVGVRQARPQGDAVEVAGLDRVVSAGDGSWRGLGDTVAILGAGSRTLASAADVGREGRIVMLADASPLQNRFLARSDNAGFSVAIAGEHRPVMFAEGQHGFGDARGLGAIPGRWRAALIGLSLAALLGIVAAGRRLGPPEDEARALPPSRRVYVDALSGSLARTGRPAEALATLQATAREGLARRAGLPPDAGERALRAAALQLGWPPDETDALFARPRTDADVLTLGRAAVRPREGTLP